MSACAETNASMQFLTDASLTTSEQHKDTSKARQSREHGDTKNILDYFQERNPFSGQGTLRSLSSGRTADESVNVDMAKTLGHKILAKMTGFTASGIKFRKQDRGFKIGCVCWWGDNQRRPNFVISQTGDNSWDQSEDATFGLRIRADRDTQKVSYDIWRYSVHPFQLNGARDIRFLVSAYNQRGT